MVNSDDNLCFKFGKLTVKLFHLLSFTKKLVSGSSASVTRLNLFFVRFIDGSSFFKEAARIICHAFEAFSRGCILLELKVIIVFFLKIFLE